MRAPEQMRIIAKRISDARRAVDTRLGIREGLLYQIKCDKEEARILERDIDKYAKALEVIQVAIKARRQEIKDRVEILVTKGLRAVFGRDDYEFIFKVTLKGSRVGLVPTLRSKFGDETLEVKIYDSHGGGVSDVVSFILRVVVLTLFRPKLSPLMVLDESFRHVSPEYLRGVAVLMEELARSTGIQFILVTHKPELLDAADVIYRAGSNKDGETIFNLEHDLRDELYHRRLKHGDPENEVTPFDHLALAVLEPDGKIVNSPSCSNLKAKRK